MLVRSLLISAIFVFSTGGALAAGPSGLQQFVRTARPAKGSQQYLLGRPVAPWASKLLGRVGLKRFIRQRNLFQVQPEKLPQYLAATSKGYLEVIFPEQVGHVYFRYGNEMFDFQDKGFVAREMRSSKRVKFGALIKLDKEQEVRLSRYLSRLKGSNGAELGKYDYHGKEGFHCVTWMMRESLGENQGESLVRILGGKDKDGRSMPRFARFLLKRAKGVTNIAVHEGAERTTQSLSSERFDNVITTLNQLRDLRRAAGL